ncbi:HdeD family acid-resistance protein [Oceaniglobus ichthyenteri]|uniref:HdeD family acid-resistance protein n=1 Tax=Oceaniglobus ichthyenteri TaxID=2136177 RepID=UPI000D3BEC3C|nr:HdeD family acid-resistance protein [Oceaniglobus ichthyenteri]
MDNTLKSLARNWWVLLVRGIAAILFGVSAFIWPGLTLSVLVLLFGAFVLADGLIGVVDAVRSRGESENWWLALIEGVLGIIVGLLALFMPGTTAFVLLAFVAVWSIIGGLLRIVAAIQLRKMIEGEWMLILSGLISVLFGIAILVLPHAGLVSIAWLIGFWAVAFGFLFVLLAFRLRKVAQ